jgi:hypothetical protein
MRRRYERANQGYRQYMAGLEDTEDKDEVDDIHESSEAFIIDNTGQHDEDTTDIPQSTRFFTS